MLKAWSLAEFYREVIEPGRGGPSEKSSVPSQIQSNKANQSQTKTMSQNKLFISGMSYSNGNLD